jgi:hypothetical protein
MKAMTSNFEVHSISRAESAKPCAPPLFPSRRQGGGGSGDGGGGDGGSGASLLQAPSGGVVTMSVPHRSAPLPM